MSVLPPFFSPSSLPRPLSLSLLPSELEDYETERDEFQVAVQRYQEDEEESALERRLTGQLGKVEVKDVLEELGLRRRRKQVMVEQECPQNKYWLHDTPGAINNCQVQ